MSPDSVQYLYMTILYTRNSVHISFGMDCDEEGRDWDGDDNEETLFRVVN